MHGFDCRLPSKFPLEVSNINYVDVWDYRMQLGIRIPEVWQLVRENLEKYREKMVQDYNKKASPVKFERTDIVRIWSPKTIKGKSAKLGKHWYGSYRIAEIRGSTAYVVPLNKPEETMKLKSIHINRLKLTETPAVPPLPNSLGDELEDQIDWEAVAREPEKPEAINAQSLT